MAAFCRDHGISLLTYGTICGGLLSERFLGRPEPGRSDLDTASLQKYKQMIDTWGGWSLFPQTGSSHGGKGFIGFTRFPEREEQYGELSCDSDDGPLLGFSCSLLGET